MKGSLHPKNDVTINPSGNESIRDVLDRVQMNRRRFLQTSVSASVLAALGGVTVEGFVRAVEAAPIPPASGFGGIGFDSIPPSLAPVGGQLADQVAVPPGYRVEPLLCWGDPIMPGAPAWLEDATQTAADQEKQFGMHCDGSHFFPFPGRGVGGGESPERGLLCVNHEYTHEEILHPDGLEHVPANPSKGVPELGLPGSTLTVQKVRKSQAAHGVSVLEVRRTGGKWRVVPSSPFGRRITANTPMKISGPAAGHALLKTRRYAITPTGSVDSNETTDGTVSWGTANNCAHGYTPWGTYIACEENWNGYFGWKATVKAPTKLESRYGIARNGFVYNNASASAESDAIYSIYKWYQVDDRWDTAINPNEPNCFGWRVEIDPFDPKSTPVKRTALGRFKCESAQFVVGNANEVGVYMGDDERNEYIYKFVCARPFDPRNRGANRSLLDEGTLYVAKFTDQAGSKTGTYRGQWIPLTPGTDTVIDHPSEGGKLKLRELEEFSGANDAEVQALICVKTRMAGDAVGATIMDRPEWTALRTYDSPGKSGARYGYGPERPLEVYCTLTNNNRRGGGGSTPPVTSVNKPDGSTAAASARPPVDVANPRPDNDYGHIIRWREDGHTPTAVGFEWDLFVLCGDSAHTKSLGGTYYKDNFIGVGAGDPDFNKRIYEGNITDVPAGSADFGAPDGMWFDHFGRLWIQTDQAGDGSGDWKNIGSNVMVCADPNTKEVRRFLTSPRNCEVTGVVTTPDGRAMFVGIQHPGEDSTASNPTEFSNWPQGQFGTNSAGIALPNGPGRRPRSTVLVITREDGGVVGT